MPPFDRFGTAATTTIIIISLISILNVDAFVHIFTRNKLRYLQPLLQDKSASSSIDSLSPFIEDNQDLSLAALFDDHLDEVTNRPINFSGDYPNWLDGALIRNGPGCFGTVEDALVPKRRYTHCFDGLSKLSSFTFNKIDKTCTFSTLFLKGNFYNSIIKEKGDIPPSVSTGPISPPFNQWQQILGAFDTSFDNTCVNIHQIGGQDGPVVAVTDAPILMEVNPATLDTKGLIKYTNSISSLGGQELFSTAHPKNDVDPNKPFTYNYFLETHPLPLPLLGGPNIAHIVRTDRDLKRTSVGKVALGKRTPYIHDLSVTPSYAVLCIWSLDSDLATLINGKGFLPQLIFNKSQNTEIYVFDLNRVDGDTNPVAKFEAPPLFAYHHVNAYEELDSQGRKQIILDAFCYETGEIVNGEYGYAYVEKMKTKTERIKSVQDGCVMRFSLPLDGELTTDDVRHVSYQKLIAKTSEGSVERGEYPIVNPNMQGRKHRYIYGVSQYLRGDDLVAVIIKHDAQLSASGSSRENTVVWQSPHCYPSEAVFVPSPFKEREDDGVLLSQVYDAHRKESFLLVLDASNMKEIAKGYLGTICALTFHGVFLQNNRR